MQKAGEVAIEILHEASAAYISEKVIGVMRESRNLDHFKEKLTELFCGTEVLPQIEFLVRRKL